MRNLEFFTLSSPDYFEPLARFPVDDRFREVAQRLLPGDWELERSEIWTLAKPQGYQTVEQGFKIHLSATVLNARSMLRRVIPVVIDAGVAFKFIAGPKLLWLTGTKNYSRGGSGKFFVAYPESQEQFEALIERLYQATKDMEGPYVLSDRRYRDGKTVYYRYGGFWRRQVLKIDGTKVPCIVDPKGAWVPDERRPYFELPSWVSDPFPPEEREGSSEGWLNGRYEVEGALSFSNSGGVYQAVDPDLGQQVVIKEARPWTACWRSEQEDESGRAPWADARTILERECRTLLKLRDLPFVPDAIDFFTDWEHLFLVEEWVPGRPLGRYRAADDFILMPYAQDRARVRQFSRGFRHIARRLLEMLARVHERGVVIGDLSPHNVMIDPESQEMALIDFECAIDLEAPSPSDGYVSRMHTAGFRHPSRREVELAQPVDDYYAAGMILYSLLMPIQSFFGLHPEAEDPFLAAYEQYASLPAEVAEVIRALLDHQVGRARGVLDEWRLEPSLSAGSTRQAAAWEERKERLDAKIDWVLAGLGRHLLSSYDIERDDRLWPGDVEVFRTNPLSVSSGAAGPLLLLRDLGREVPEDVVEWLAGRDIDKNLLPPGLYTGLSGIARTFAEVGLEERAEEALEQAAGSPLLYEAADHFQGAAGWGWTRLWFHRRDGDERHLLAAYEAGEKVLEMAEPTGDGLCWRNPIDDRVHFGMGFGATGVGLFLLELFEATGERRLRQAAEEAIRFEVARAFDPEDRQLKWPNHEQADGVFEPYWRHGSAGIASALVRFSETLDEPRYLALARRAGSYAYTKFCVQPSQFEGSSGIGEAMLDLHRATGERSYLQKAYEVAEGTLLYALDQEGGKVAFPGRLLLRISDDFGTGGAGVGAFLHRLRTLSPRRFHDLRAVPAAERPEGVAARVEAPSGREVVAC